MIPTGRTKANGEPIYREVLIENNGIRPHLEMKTYNHTAEKYKPVIDEAYSYLFRPEDYASKVRQDTPLVKKAKKKKPAESSANAGCGKLLEDKSAS